MRGERIYKAIGAVDDELLIRSEKAKKRKPNPWVIIGSLAACLCLVAWGAITGFQSFNSNNSSISMVASDPELSGRPVLQWAENFTAEDYFMYSNNTYNRSEMAIVRGMPSTESFDAESFDTGSVMLQEQSLLPDSAIPYTESRYFSDERSHMEAEGVIPVMGDYPTFYCAVNKF
ncbi:MAG: hypothetical protein FWD21_03585, partial [Peptococcaceae bacterium]|nr:hypothetical protein [Peptococcaceae bacterium]